MIQAKPKIAILAFDRNFAIAPRIINEIKSLGFKYRIDGYGESCIEGLHEFYRVMRPNRYIYRIVKIIGGPFPRFRIWFEKWFYHQLCEQIHSKDYRFLISHNVEDALISLYTGVPYFFNSEEYLPLQFDGNPIFRFTELKYRDIALKKILRHAILVIVEGESVANKYATEYNISINKFCVFYNMTAYRSRISQCSVKPRGIKLVHHGLLAPARGLDLLLKIAIALGPQFHLTLMGPITPKSYIKKLYKKTEKFTNITIQPPVPYEKIVEHLFGHDLGVIIFGSPHFHHKFMTVPNKFWECLQARVPVLVSPESAMATYVKESGCGIVAESASFKGYVESIQSLTQEKINKMKECCEEEAWNNSLNSHMQDFALIIENSIDVIYGTYNFHQ